ncbi:unnamed protein product [Symbiodinium sp. CCMP2456]|nr:unnamed protein product [Symbiodinium sp. CCMP2456]
MWRSEITTGLHAALADFFGGLVAVFLFSEPFLLSVCARQEVTDMRHGVILADRWFMESWPHFSAARTSHIFFPELGCRGPKDPADDQPVWTIFVLSPSARMQPRGAA